MPREASQMEASPALLKEFVPEEEPGKQVA